MVLFPGRFVYYAIPFFVSLSSPCPYISHVTCQENLFQHQYIVTLMIMIVILVTCMFDQVVIWKGEIRCWSFYA